eukprot:TRINITY_DN27556_c1_g1_i2.p1 TRINITY_DN27556_c1_g1~~TRINITY_DN27556_c1_g1_i2.p1  ORF type:complete len:127 (-),score=11.94 TRINITY_DN27556_c1_g1_i2:80-460(-)
MDSPVVAAGSESMRSFPKLAITFKMPLVFIAPSTKTSGTLSSSCYTICIGHHPKFSGGWLTASLWVKSHFVPVLLDRRCWAWGNCTYPKAELARLLAVLLLLSNTSQELRTPVAKGGFRRPTLSTK